MPTALQLTILLKELKRTILEEAYSWQYDNYAEEHWDGVPPLQVLGIHMSQIFSPAQSYSWI